MPLPKIIVTPFFISTTFANWLFKRWKPVKEFKINGTVWPKDAQFHLVFVSLGRQ